MPGVQHLGVERLAGGDQAGEREPVSVARLAITRYSVGAMQSTSTCSRSISSSRSCGSKRASCSSAAAPRSQGAMNALRADFDQPAAAVHQTSWPGCGREPVLGLQLLAGEVALAVQHGLRLAAACRR